MITMANKVLHYKKDLLEALEKTRGIVSTACELVKCSRTAYYSYMKNDEEFRLAVEELSNIALDFAESKLFEKMEGIQVQKKAQNGDDIIYTVPPSDTALIFYLKTKGKSRGYIERMETENINYNLNHTLVFEPQGTKPHVEDNPAE